MDILEGKALWNGIVFRNSTHTVTAKRNRDGFITVTSKPNIHRDALRQSSPILDEKITHAPLIRGLRDLFYCYGKNKYMKILGLTWLVLTIVTMVNRNSKPITPIFSRYALYWGLGVILTAILFSFRFSPLSKYHGAEHMAFRCFESNCELTVPNIRCQTRVLTECGSNLLINTIVVMLLLVILGLPVLFSFVTGYAIGYEVSVAGENTLLRQLFIPIQILSMTLQKFFLTASPIDMEIEVAIRAIRELERLDNTGMKSIT